VHEEAAYRCWCAGTCCASGYVVSLDREEANRVRAAALRIHVEEDPVCLLPRAPNSAWTWALANDPSCPFLDEAFRCRIHDTDALPSTCQVYPLAFVMFAGRVHASVTHRCVCGALDRGEPLSAQLDSIARKLSAVKHVPVLPKQTRLDAYTQLATEEAIEVLVAATDGARDPWELLLDAIEGLRACAVEVDVGGALEDPDAIFGRLGAYLDETSDLTLACALQGRRHPNGELIEASLLRAGLHRPHEDPRREALRFLRDYLSGLRIYRFTTLAHGLFAAGLALHAILAGDPPHPLARERIMLWEDALLSPVLRALLGADGPLAAVTASIGNVARQVELIRR
jgi:Fe-S-cluster containining protein